MNTTEATLLAARVIAELKAAGIEPARAEYGLIVQAFCTLDESRNEGDHRLAGEICDLFPGVINSYDSRGNYIGNVSNENGWTA